MSVNTNNTPEAAAIATSTNSTVTPSLFEPLLLYLTHYSLPRQTEENVFLQRLKVLASASHQFVKFKQLTDDHFLIYAEFEQTQAVPNITVTVKKADTEPIAYQFSIDQLLPSRSVVVRCNENVASVENYTIKRVINVHPQVFHNAMLRTKRNAQISYEGTIIVANHSESHEWTLRTTSCPDAFKSYYGSDVSHGQLFANLCQRNHQQEWTAVLDQMQTIYGKHSYFVFVLVAKDTQHVCQYPNLTDGSDIFLISVRSELTHEEADISNERLFRSSESLTLEEVGQSLTDNSNFDGKMVNVQGFVVTDENGYLLRCLTGAYYYATTKFPHHSDSFISALHCFTLGSFHELVNMRNIDREASKKMFDQCSLTVKTISNMAAFLFTTFTRLKIIPTRSYEKINGELYKVLKMKCPTSIYLQVLPMLQTHAIKSSAAFTQLNQLSHDIENYIKSFGQTKDGFQKVIDLMYAYNEFRDSLDECIQQCKRENDAMQLRTFVNVDDTGFSSIVKTHLKHEKAETETN
jgi:hypothetical protein